MRKNIFIILLSLFLILISTASAQWDDCLRGEEGCAYPGDCGAYVDTNKDGICDHSQPEPTTSTTTTSISQSTNSTTESEDVHDLLTGQELKSMTVAEVAEVYDVDKKEFAEALSDFYGVKISSVQSFQLLHDNYGVAPSEAKDIVSQLAVAGTKMTSKDSSVDNTTEQTQSKTQTGKERRGYHLVSIILILTIFYLATWSSAKSGKISLVQHRKIWNWLLLVTFLVSGLLGLLLVIRINYGLPITLPFNILYWHVEAGVAMAIISFFHIAWHWKYYASGFLKKKKNNQ
jgi:cation transport ATPase